MDPYDRRRSLALAGAEASDTYVDLRNEVFRDIIAPDYRFEIQNVVTSRHRWKKAANWFEGMAQVFLGVSTMLCFAAGFFGDKYWAFAAGCCSTCCQVLIWSSTYAENESAERHSILSRLLAGIGLGPVPPITDASTPDASVAGSRARGATSQAAAPPRQGGQGGQGSQGSQFLAVPSLPAPGLRQDPRVVSWVTQLGAAGHAASGSTGPAAVGLAVGHAGPAAGLAGAAVGPATVGLAGAAAGPAAGEPLAAAPADDHPRDAPAGGSVYSGDVWA